MKIGINSNNIKWNKESFTFKVKGSDVRFDTSYEVVNERTGKSESFFLDHSTGSEWDRNTKWIYKTKDGKLILEVGNEEVTNTMIANYANTKNR